MSDSGSVVQIQVTVWISLIPGWFVRCRFQAFNAVREFVMGYVMGYLPAISGKNVRSLSPQCVET